MTTNQNHTPLCFDGKTLPVRGLCRSISPRSKKRRRGLLSRDLTRHTTNVMKYD